MSEDKEAWRRRLVDELFGGPNRGPLVPPPAAGQAESELSKAPPHAGVPLERAPANVERVENLTSPPPLPQAANQDLAAGKSRPTGSASTPRLRLYSAGAALTIFGLLGGLLLGRSTVRLPHTSADVGDPRSAPSASARSALALTSATQAMCTSPTTFEGLKAIVLGQARRLGGPNPAWLEARMSAATLHVDGAYLKAMDTANTVTLCSGRLAVRLPDTGPAATSIDPLPVVAVDYAILPATDVRGRVYILDGATSLVRKLVELEPEATASPDYSPA